jgi:hypothetical protein
MRTCRALFCFLKYLRQRQARCLRVQKHGDHGEDDRSAEEEDGDLLRLAADAEADEVVEDEEGRDPVCEDEEDEDESDEAGG